jgi:O-antigen ligase
MGLIMSVAITLERYQQEAARSGVPFKYKLASVLETTGRTGAAMLAGIFILCVGLLGTGSRGGSISTLFALFVFAVLTGQSRSSGKEQRLTILVAGLVLLAVFIGFSDELVGHVRESGISDQSRLKVWRAILDSIGAAPFLGYGYGTFADVFPVFRTDVIVPFTDRWAMAHNTYLEVLQGLGLVFGAMLILSVGSLLLICLRGATTRRRDAMVPRAAVSVGMLVGLHSLVDFSLQIQAITLTFMAILGAGTAQAFSSQLSTADAETMPPERRGSGI